MSKMILIEELEAKRARDALVQLNALQKPLPDSNACLAVSALDKALDRVASASSTYLVTQPLVADQKDPLLAKFEKWAAKEGLVVWNDEAHGEMKLHAAADSSEAARAGLIAFPSLKNKLTLKVTSCPK